MPPSDWSDLRPTACLVLADGTVIEGYGIGAVGERAGELCFNTAMTGYQEILTDPSYSGQIVTFTFPHIGNTGVNEEDSETMKAGLGSGVCGVVIHAPITEPANWRATRSFDAWLKAHGIPGISGVDTRALTALIRDRGMSNAILAHEPSGVFEIERLKRDAASLPSMEGLDLVPGVTGAHQSRWEETVWRLGEGHGRQSQARHHVVAIDYGIKSNILRLLAESGLRITVVPASVSADAILALAPDGVFLSNGPGDPAATGEYALKTIRALLDRRIPIFGICLGHQMLALALGGSTVKMGHGHHGANHPVKDVMTGKVEIVSMNHGFAVDPSSLPASVTQTHISLFDGSNCGLALADGSAFSVQHHPEASPGPRDSHYLFARFLDMIERHKEKQAA